MRQFKSPFNFHKDNKKLFQNQPGEKIFYLLL